MKVLFKKVCIIGVGLIGGSLALGIRKHRISRQIIGFFRRRNSLRKAVSKGIVDKGYLNLEKAVKNADLIIFSTPVYEILRLGKEVKKYITPRNVVVTDTGSTKSLIVRKISKIYPCYIGSHPLAGSEKKGCDFSSADLFNGRMTVLTPRKNFRKETLRVIKTFWERLGSRVVIMNPDAHDKLFCRLSHFPHLLIYVLMNLVKEEELPYASSGFNDVTRIAASDPNLWLQIFTSNKKNILRDMKLFSRVLNKYKNSIMRDKEEILLNFLREAWRKRKCLESEK